MRHQTRLLAALSIVLWIVAVTFTVRHGDMYISRFANAAAVTATVVAALRRQTIAADRVFDYGWKSAMQHAREHPDAVTQR